MKVAHINMTYGRGSTGKIVLAICEQLEMAGHEGYVCYSQANIEPQLGYHVGNKQSLRKHQILSRLGGNQGWHSTAETKRLVNELRNFKPDLIHLHNIHGYFINMDILFKYLAEAHVQVVWTLHDCWAFTGHCTHFTAANCEKWKSECRDCPCIHDYPYSIFFDRSNDLFKKKKKLYANVKNLWITTVSNWLASEVKSSVLLGDRPVVTISNGINTDVFRPIDSIEKTVGVAKKVILGVANVWGKRKGLEDFIKLSTMLTDDYQIVLVGLKPKQISNLPKNIIGLQRTESTEALVKLYNSADVFFNPSVEETFGLTTVEAMACGTPVIVYDSTASPELVTNNTGFVIPVKDLDAAKDSIEKIIAKGKSAYTQACRNLVMQKYNEKENYKKYLSLYEELLK